MIYLRQMVLADIPAGLRLCRQANWNQLANDWKYFLQFSPDGCRVAVNEGNVVGTVTTISYQAAFSWIGMVLVDEAHRRQGIGIRLLKEALEILKHEKTVKLDATPAGREVYLKLLFVDEYKLSRMQISNQREDWKSIGTRSAVNDDLQAICEFDRPVFGADRADLLKQVWEKAPQYAFISENDLGINGYSLGRDGQNFGYIGPVVAKDISAAKNLVMATLKAITGQSLSLDAMHFDAQWMDWLRQIGFREQRRLIRMYRGVETNTGLPEAQFAILGPEFG